MPVHTHCVVIELKRVDEGRILKYLYEHVYSYNWILKEDEETNKVRVCVWWREEDYRQFCTTPLRSFLKRLKNKAVYDSIKISKRMSTEEGIQTVCKGVPGSISKYYLEAPLYPYLRGLLAVDPPGIEEPENETKPYTKCNLILKIVDPLDISAKIDLLQKITTNVAIHVKRLSEDKRLSEEIEGNVPSPLITHTGESTTSSLFTEPNMELEDPFLPIIPSGPSLF